MADGNTPASSDTNTTCEQFEAAEDFPTNNSQNPTLGDIIEERLSRRGLMSGLLATTAVASAISPSLFLAGCDNTPSTTPSFDFGEVTVGSDGYHYVAKGYNADILIRWGDAVLPNAPKFEPLNQSADAQSAQFGYNNDFLGFLPVGNDRTRGLLVVNHEYTNEELMFPGLKRQDKKTRFAEMTTDLVAIEMMAHGGSVIEIARPEANGKPTGKWSVVENSYYARRITAQTEMKISGPAAGDDRMKTSYDRSGKKVLGMLNNCAGALTPWGTWLTCEENFNGYFWGKEHAADASESASLRRYGAPSEWYCWGKFHDRFDIEKEPNEINRFGWVVEIDPFDPRSTPVKRTALGRFKHEGAGNVVNRDGRFVVYQGDDQHFEYVYRFVSRDKVDMANPKANRDILDNGTLYVARFNANGTGIWLPLEFGQGPLTPASGFHSQADVVIDARIAADLLGATKMDRPEDIDANPKTGKVYVMLTQNPRRDAATVNAANPRADNNFGHIIEIMPDGGDHARPTFRWEILVKCGNPAIAEVGATFNPATSENGWFGMPDNCAIDAEGRLWVATDGNSMSRTGRTDGVWALETEGKARGTSKLFFRCPVGAELCGPAFTPDMETFFVAVQHPGQAAAGEASTFNSPLTRWPDFKYGTPPRPSVVAITRRGGGKIAV